MSRIKAPNTDHAYFRAAERCGWGKKKAKEMMKLAQRYGKCWQNLPPGPGRDWLQGKQEVNRRRIKYYNGYVFVFASTSTRCITVYPHDLEAESENEDE
jgi:hypothetical protein